MKRKEFYFSLHFPQLIKKGCKDAAAFYRQFYLAQIFMIENIINLQSFHDSFFK